MEKKIFRAYVRRDGKLTHVLVRGEKIQQALGYVLDDAANSEVYSIMEDDTIILN